MPLDLVRDGEVRETAGLARPVARIVEFSGQQIYQKADEVFNRLSAQAEVLLIRQLPEVLHVRELFLNFIRKYYSDETALKVSATLFERKERADEHTVAAFVAAARHLRDTGAMSALFSRLIRSFDLPPPINVDCGFFRLVASDDLFARMNVRHDLLERDDWHYSFPYDSVEPTLGRGSAMPHRDLAHPHYAFQFNLWFPLADLAENESLLFFPEAYFNYKERIETLLGRPSIGFVDDVRQVGAQIAANPNPCDWGFGQPASNKLDFGDTYMFYCQQVHASPIRRADSLRLSVEVRVACRCVDDNAGYRRIFSNLNNFLPANESGDERTSGIERADALASPSGPSADVPAGRVNGNSQHYATCAQLYLNSLFPTPVLARKAKELSQPADVFDLGPRVTGALLNDALERCDRFPFAEDRSVLLARLFLRRADDVAAAGIIGKAAERSRNYFWQLQLAYLAIRAHHKDLACRILDRCRSLAEKSTLEAFPFMPELEIPTHPIIAMLPEHAIRAVAAISASIDRLPNGAYGSDIWYTFDPRLFHPHNYHIRRHKRADFHKTGSLFLAIPAGHRFVPEEIVAGRQTKVCFAETIEDLEFEYDLREKFFPTSEVEVVSSAVASLEREQSLIQGAFERLEALELTVEERTKRLTALERTIDERTNRLTQLEAAAQRRVLFRFGSLLRRGTLSRQV